MKKKILAYCDSPTVATGFGTVSYNILEKLHKTGKYDIDIFGVNYHGTPHNKPFNIWPAMDQGDPYGRKKFCYFAMKHDFDILWVLQDTFMVDFLPELIPHLKQSRTKPFKSIMYYPVDSVLKQSWYKNIKDVDYLVAYTEFGKKALQVHDPERPVDVIYHGINTKDFFVLPDEDVKAFREHYFGKHKDKFIIMNVNRNQQRKDLPKTLMAFKEFKKEVPESMLYLHMAKKDQGWDLPGLCESMDLSISEDVAFPEGFEPNSGYPKDVLNMLYNVADCVVSTTLGEGMGLGWLESMACKTPVIMPNNTAMQELIKDNMGYLVDSGTNLNLWTCLPNDNEIMRPMVDVHDMKAKMLDVYNNYYEAKEKSEEAYKWLHKELRWEDKILRQWEKIFNEAVSALGTKETSTPNKIIDSEEL